MFETFFNYFFKYFIWIKCGCPFLNKQQKYPCRRYKISSKIVYDFLIFSMLSRKNKPELKSNNILSYKIIISSSRMFCFPLNIGLLKYHNIVWTTTTTSTSISKLSMSHFSKSNKSHRKYQRHHLSELLHFKCELFIQEEMTTHWKKYFDVSRI